MKKFYSSLLKVLSLFLGLFSFIPAIWSQCHTYAFSDGACGSSVGIELTDSWGDGWNGNYLTVCKNGVVETTVTIASGSYATYTLTGLVAGDTWSCYYNAAPGNSWETENGFKFDLDGDGSYDDGATFTPTNTNSFQATSGTCGYGNARSYLSNYMTTGGVQLNDLNYVNPDILTDQTWYQNRTTESCNLVEGVTYPLTVTGGDSWGNGGTGYSWLMVTHVYIDWNMDGIIDPGTDMYNLGSCASAGGTVSIDVTPPAGSAASCFMRVVQGFDGDQPPAFGAYNSSLAANSYGTTVSHGSVTDFFVSCTAPASSISVDVESAGFSTCTSGESTVVEIGVTLSGVSNATVVPPSNVALSTGGLYSAAGQSVSISGSSSIFSKITGTAVAEGEVFTDEIRITDDAGIATSVSIPTVVAGQLPVANATYAGVDQSVCPGTDVTLTAALTNASPSTSCLTFADANDYVNCGNNSALNFTGSEITIEAWIYPTAWRTNKWEGSIINNEDNNSGYMLRCGASGTLDFNWGDNSAWNDCSSSSGALTLNTWQHVAATYDGATIKLYVNGSLVASQADVFTGESSNNNIWIGNSEYSSSRYFIGSIDEVRVWKYSRSARDIQALMNRELSVVAIGSATGLVGYWNMNEGTGSAIEDQSTNGGDGTAVSTSWNASSPSELENTFSWDNSVTDGVAFTPPAGATTTYTATQTINDGCSTSSDAVDVTVNTAPTATLNSPSSCSGQTATMTASPVGGSGVYSTYTWTVPVGESAPGNVSSFSASTAGSYTVAVTDNAGCSSSDAAGTFTDAGSTNTWDGSEGTDWTDAENWSCGAVPTSSSDVVIADVTNQPIIGSAADAATLTISSGADLTISSNTLTVSGVSDLNGNLSIGTGTYNADGEFDAAGSITFSGAGTLVLSSTVTSMGSSLTNTVGTVKYDGTSAQDVVAPSSGGYYNLTIENASTKTATGNIDVNGALTTEAEASCVLDLSTYDLNVAGNLTVGQEGGLDASDAACAVTFDGNSSLTHAGSQIVTNTLTPGQELLNDGLSNLNNWTAEQHSSSTSWSVGDGSAYFSANSGGSCAWMQESNYNYSEASIIYDLPSPQTGMSVSFYYINPSWAGDIDWLDVDYYNGSIWTNIVRYSAGAASWTSVSSLAIPDGATKVRFYGMLGYGFGVGVDDVIITGDANVLTLTSINPTFNEIVVNGGDVTLAQDVDVTTTLTLTSGDIITSSSNKLTIESSAASALTTGSASSMIVGPFDRKTNSTDDYLLPVGDGTNYRPVVITPSTTTATTYTAEFKNTAHTSISYDANGNNNTPCTVPNDLDHVANGCWWDIERTTSGSDCYVALNWDATCGVDTPNDIVLAHYNGSSWDKIGATLTDNTGSGSATASNGRVKSDLFVGDFSPFNLGSGSGNNSLPIDLLSFHTECSHDIVDVNFSVVSQINNEKFLIERSTDALAWEVVGELPGVPGGNSNTQMDYLFTDNNPLANLSYYRLTQVDFDGKAKTFYPVSSSCGSTVGGLPVDVYPNPAWSDVTIEFELDQYQGDDVYYTITDATGKTVMSDYLELNKGFNKNTLDINKLPRGVYILRFNQTKDHITETRIVKR